MPADAAARRIADAIGRGRRDVVLTGHGKALVFLARHFPRLVAALARRLAGPARTRGAAPPRSH
jgi:aspartate oxidase